jgi:hypothetical protein
MIARMRASLMGLLVAVAIGGCESSPKKLSCSQSVADACASRTCPASWDDAVSGTGLCSAQDPAPPTRADCGAYHAVAVAHFDSVETLYYDNVTGSLVAIVGAYPPNSSATCSAGPATGFVLPTCEGPISETLSQCLDGGTSD